MPLRTDYPDLRADRSGPPLGGTPRPPTPPQAGTTARTRVIGFRLDSNIGLRTTTSTALIKGPFLIQQIQAVVTNPAQDRTSLDIGYANAPVEETDVALTTPKRWTSIVDRVSRNVVAESVQRTGMPGFGWTVEASSAVLNLNALVQVPEAFVIISVIMHGAVAGQAYTGELIIVEAIPPEALRNFR